MSARAQKAFAYCGLIFPLVFFVGMLLAGLLPPHSPSDSAQEVVNEWKDDEDMKRLGLMLCMFAGGLTAPLGAVISTHLKRIEPESTYSNLQLIGAACGVIAILVPIFIWAAVAFRPDDRSAEIMQALNDMAWIPFVMNVPPALMQTFAIGFAALDDKSPNPVFPRWLGYYNLWTALVFAAGCLVIFFKSGPFAWNGAIAFWLVAVMFGAWFIVMSLACLKATREAQEAPAPA